MLKDIPTHLIAGSLGAGKTSLIRALLAQQPAGERWAVLINEYGRIGLDAALLEGEGQNVVLTEVAGGCLCCVNGVPFRVALNRLLRQARPDRLLIEPSGLGHPLELLRQLQQPPWTQVLALQPPILVLDAAALASGEPLPETSRQALPQAGLLVLNKSERLDEGTRQSLLAQLPSKPHCWTCQGQLALRDIPGHEAQARAGAGKQGLPPAGPLPLPAFWPDPRQPHCQSQASLDGWSIGWRWHPSQRFDLHRLATWLAGLPWRRAKLVIHAVEGWQSANAVQGGALSFKPSAWRKDSRLELIFAEPQPERSLHEALDACREDGA